MKSGTAAALEQDDDHERFSARPYIKQEEAECEDSAN